MYSSGRRGVALLIVLMIVLGLLILGQAAMLLLDNMALRSGNYRRLQIGSYCAEEGLNLGRAWVLQNMTPGSTQLNPVLLNGPNGFFADPTNAKTGPNSLTAKDLCQAATGPGTIVAGAKTVPYTGIVCRTDPQTGAAMYRINLLDDMDEGPGSQYDPFNDKNNVFIIRAECTAGESFTNSGQGLEFQDVAMIEVNQSGASGCYGSNAGPTGAGSNSAGCGGGYVN